MFLYNFILEGVKVVNRINLMKIQDLFIQFVKN